MSLNQTAIYALRAMSWLALQPTDSAYRSADVAHATGIPDQYVVKILRRLVVAELLTSRKGRGGGFCLARGPQAITFFDVLEAVDAIPDLKHCAFGWGQCDALEPCPLHRKWSEHLDGFVEWARSSRLADVDPVSEERARAWLERPGQGSR
jgi:Rrf2 family iron-sulfur cluster assembly transcriptional regulator